MDIRTSKEIEKGHYLYSDERWVKVDKIIKYTKCCKDYPKICNKCYGELIKRLTKGEK